MAGYIGSKAAVTQVDGYTKSEADDRYVNDTGDTVTFTSNEGDALLIEQADGTDVGSLRINNGSFILKGKHSTNPVQIQTHDGNEDIEVDPDGFIKMETAGSERLRIDSAGRVTMPYQPSFRMKGGSSGWVSVGTNTSTTLTWNTALHNIGSHFSSMSFTAPVAGRYIFNQSIYGRLNSGQGDNTNYWTSHFAVNNSIVENTSIVGYQNDGDYDNAYSASTILNLSANDFVSIQMRGNGVQANYYDSNCYFSGHLLG